MNKRKTYTGEFKAKVVIELIRGKKELKELASEYDLHPNQIKNWKVRFLNQAADIFEDGRRQKKEENEDKKRNL